MAESKIPCRHSALTKTYTTNSYISQTDFNRISAYQCENLVVVDVNLYITTTIPDGTQVTIGKINLPSNAKQNARMNVKPQGGTGTANLGIASDGTITAGGQGGTALGWVRCNLTLVL